MKLDHLGKNMKDSVIWQERCLGSFGNQDLLRSTQLRSEDSSGSGDGGVESGILLVACHPVDL